jgi:MFS superfamily sulfate permease-like transporter
MPAPSESRSRIDLAMLRGTLREWPPRLVPGITWIQRYHRRDLPHDAIAGLTVAAVIVPIGMAYGQLSRLPPITGLNASLLPLLTYALFGSSRQLIIGHDASSAALMVAAVAPPPAGNVERALDFAALLAILIATGEQQRYRWVLVSVSQPLNGAR